MACRSRPPLVSGAQRVRPENRANTGLERAAARTVVRRPHCELFSPTVAYQQLRRHAPRLSCSSRDGQRPVKSGSEAGERHPKSDGAAAGLEFGCHGEARLERAAPCLRRTVSVWPPSGYDQVTDAARTVAPYLPSLRLRRRGASPGGRTAQNVDGVFPIVNRSCLPPVAGRCRPPPGPRLRPKLYRDPRSPRS